jgi:hypothetical protein
MKYAARILTLVVMMTPILASAQLASNQKLAADIPFQFRVGNTLIPAGKCIVQRAGLDPRTLVIRNSSAGASLFSSSTMGNVKEASRTNAMVFHKYGNRYFLAGVKLEGSNVVYKLPEGRAEAELRAQNIPAGEETLLALLQ